MSQFIEMFGNLPIDGTIADVVERNIKSVKKNFSPEDIIEYIDISSVDSSSHTIVETSQHVVSHAPSRAQQCVESGDILVSTVRPINRNIAVVKSELSNLVASTGFCVLRPKDGFREYILSIVQSDPYTEQMCDKASGGLYPAVNNGDVLSFGIHIPDESQLKKVTYIYRQADKSKFGDFKSQFIEMFGNPFENNSEMVPLSLLCSINPSKPKGLDDSLSVSFIPMDRISEGGEYTEFETKPLKDVKKGFTFCAEDDVLFAKITPCMENGKGAILKGLSNGIGFGSTEFHVLRPIPGITNSEWLYFLTKLSGFRLDAAKNMTGTGGQKRVPSSYLLNFKVMRPQLVAQKEFAEIVRQADKSKSVIQKALVYLNDIQSDELGKIAYFLN